MERHKWFGAVSNDRRAQNGGFSLFNLHGTTELSLLCLGVKACQSPQILNGLSDLNTGPLFIPTAPGENMARSEQYQLLTCVD